MLLCGYAALGFRMIKHVRSSISHLEEVLCAVLFAIMSVVTCANIFSRYLLKYSFAFTEELVVSFFVWLILLGAAIAFRERSHLGFSFIVDRLPQRIQKFFLWLSAGLAASLFLFLIYFSVRQIGEEISLGITSSGIGIPQWWYTIGVPLWSVPIIVRIFQGAHRAGHKIGGS
jgi:TRAP-type C4-dicarboxylate transport system permease small subunit